MLRIPGLVHCRQQCREIHYLTAALCRFVPLLSAHAQFNFRFLLLSPVKLHKGVVCNSLKCVLLRARHVPLVHFVKRLIYVLEHRGA